MKSNRLRGCLVVAALCAGTASASAQNTHEKTDDKTAPVQGAQATEPAPAPARPTPPPTPAADMPGSSGPTTPGPARMTDEELRKMVQEEVGKMKPKG